jgi:hypothetical protein
MLAAFVGIYAVVTWLLVLVVRRENPQVSAEVAA